MTVLAGVMISNENVTTVELDLPLRDFVVEGENDDVRSAYLK